jgi:hypothetical protein
VAEALCAERCPDETGSGHADFWMDDSGMAIKSFVRVWDMGVFEC